MNFKNYYKNFFFEKTQNFPTIQTFSFLGCENEENSRVFLCIDWRKLGFSWKMCMKRNILWSCDTFPWYIIAIIYFIIKCRRHKIVNHRDFFFIIWNKFFEFLETHPKFPLCVQFKKLLFTFTNLSFFTICPHFGEFFLRNLKKSFYLDFFFVILWNSTKIW